MPLAVRSPILVLTFALSVSLAPAAPGGSPHPRIDCNENGVDDAVDIALGTSGDANANGVPDECEEASEMRLRGA